MRIIKVAPLESGWTLAVAAFVAQKTFWACLLVLPLSWCAVAMDVESTAASAFAAGVWRMLFFSANTLALVRIYERLCDRWPWPDDDA